MAANSPINREQAAKISGAFDQAADFLFVTRKWAPAMGGMETWSVKLSEHLGALHPLDVVALAGRDNGMPPSAVRLLLFPFTVLLRYFTRSSAPKALIIVDMALWPIALLTWLRRGNPKVLIAAHGTDVSYPRRGGLKGSLYGAYLRIGSRLLPKAKVIANSRATADVASETDWTNATVIPLGTDLHHVEPRAAHNGNILFAGRLVHLKGCGWFTREVLPHLPHDIRLQIAGTGWDESEAHVLGDPRVDHLGCLSPDALAEAYSHALCVIVPNIDPANGAYEGFGLVAPEAASSGAIVLAANHGGLRDAVIDGETGQLLPTGDAQAWIDAIVKVAALSENERIKACSTAQNKAREHYTWSRVALSMIAQIEAIQ